MTSIDRFNSLRSRSAGTRRVRDQRGVVYPSPLIMLSVIAIAMAAIAFVATRGGSAPTERKVEIVDAQPSTTPTPTVRPSVKPKPHRKPVDRGRVDVFIFNNSRITGLAGDVSSTVTKVGWHVLGVDNWYGTVPATTVYYPAHMKRAATLLALDLGIRRTAPAVDPMKTDRLTLILTAPLAAT